MKSANRIIYLCLAVMTIVSCAESYETYNIQGVSSVSMEHGNTLSLKVFRDANLADFDSCEMVHGNFSFAGRIDTTQLGFIVIDDLPQPVPLVIETGLISVHIDRGMSRVSGTPLNDKLYDYLEHYNQLMNYSAELKTRTYDALSLRSRKDSLETNFIIENSDNVAGFYAFLQMVSELVETQRLITPQLEEIMQRASKSFRTNPFVVNYYREAREYMDSKRGTATSKPTTKETLNSE
jgi:hypothetical protein